MPFRIILSGFFNIDHGFSRNLIELLYRPGYMIRDYLKGKRVHYYKPFQTLFVLAALYIMGVQLIDPAAIKLSEKEMEERAYYRQPDGRHQVPTGTEHQTVVPNII